MQRVIVGTGFTGVDRNVWLPALRALRRRRSVILGYHGVAAVDPRHDLSRLQVAPAEFRRQIELLALAGFRFLTMRDAADALADRSPEPGIAVITFDDGLRNNLTVALPILREIGVEAATVYIATDFIGAHSPWLAAGAGGDILAAAEIAELAREGWEIGGHTMSHPDMSRLDYGECRAEIEGGIRELERISGARVHTFAYPFGRYGSAALAAARDSGVRAAVTTGSGLWRRLELTRAMSSRGDPYAVLMLKMLNGYEPLLRLAPLRVARELSRAARDRLRHSRR
jgi:peptidoglycan/xylan/chitin deacetylase (PgdA/CDA1 family)